MEHVAQEMAAAMLPTLESRRYFWTRVSTTVCEDVGFADPDLMRFVIACAQSFPPSVGPNQLARVWGFLTHEMCHTQRSRIFCQMSLLEDFFVKERLRVEGLDDWERNALNVILTLKNRDHGFWSDHENAWLLRNNWRGQNMLKFQNYAPNGGIVLQPEADALMFAPPSERLFDLPDFSYDMHTRVGKRVITRLCGVPLVKEFYLRHPAFKHTEPIGWALFVLEGALVPGGLIDVNLSRLEHKFLARRSNWSMETWAAFQRLMSQLLFEDRTVNRLRLDVLAEQDYL